MAILMLPIEKDLGQADHLYLNLCKMECKISVENFNFLLENFLFFIKNFTKKTCEGQR